MHIIHAALFIYFPDSHVQSLFCLLHIRDLYIVTQLVEHIDKRLIHYAVLLVYKPADVWCGSSDHFRKLRLGNTFFQAFYHNAPRSM